MAEPLAQTLNHRKYALATMDGFPAGANIIGRVRSLITLSSFAEMLTSIALLRDLLRFAADMASMIKIVDVRRHALNRSEVVALLTSNAAAYGIPSLTPEQADFLAYVIISAEDTTATWTLLSDQKANPIIQFDEMYETVHRALRKKTASELACYDVAASSVATYGAVLPNQKETMAAFSAMRQIDHVMQMYFDLDAWKAFLPERTGNTPAETIDRANGLRSLAAYLHSVLLLPYAHAVYAVRAAYDAFGAWVGVLPPIPAHVTKLFDDNVPPHDFLHAAADIASLSNMAAGSAASLDTDSRVHITFEEFLDVFAIDEALRTALKKAAGAIPPFNVSAIQALQSPTAQFALQGLPVARHYAVQSAATLVVVADLLSDRMRASASLFGASVAVFFAPEIADKLRSLNINSSLPPLAHIDYGVSPVVATPATISNGSILFQPGHAAATYAYTHHLRVNTFGGIATGPTFFEKFRPWALVNRDVADWFTTTFDLYQMALVPATLSNGSQVWTTDAFIADRNDQQLLRHIIEQITGQTLLFFLTTIDAPISRKRFATSVSSFALMYRENAAGSSKNDAGKPTFEVVVGDGMPYGTSYSDLSARQGPIQPEQLIPLANGYHLRFLSKIPVPSRKLVRLPYVAEREGMYYFQASRPDHDKDVREWTFDSSALQYAMYPVEVTSFAVDPEAIDRLLKNATAPGSPLSLRAASGAWILFDTAYSYVLQNYYLANDMKQTLTIPGEGAGRVTTREQSWSGEKMRIFLRYINFPAYFGAGQQTSDSKVTTMIADLNNQLESAVNASDESARASTHHNQEVSLNATLTIADQAGDGGRRSGPSQPRRAQNNPKQKKSEPDPKSTGIVEEPASGSTKPEAPSALSPLDTDELKDEKKKKNKK